MTKSKLINQTLLGFPLFLFIYFFLYQGFLHRYWRFKGQQVKGGDHLLFHSTTSTPSRILRHLFATLNVRWLSHIFNRNACLPDCYSIRYTTLSNYHLSDWLMMHCLFVYLMTLSRLCITSKPTNQVETIALWFRLTLICELLHFVFLKGLF